MKSNIINKPKRSFLSVREIVEISLLVSLAVLLDQTGFKIKVSPTFGSISFTMVPLVFIALRYGFIKSFFAIGVIYGFITSLTDNSPLVAYPLDYLLAYGSLSLISFIAPVLEKNRNKPVSYLVLAGGISYALAARLFFHTLSGVLIWEADPAGSLVYNLVFVILPPLAPTLVSCLLLLKSYYRINDRFPPDGK